MKVSSTFRAFFVPLVLCIAVSCNKANTDTAPAVAIADSHVEVSSRSAMISVSLDIKDGGTVLYCGVLVSGKGSPQTDPEAVTKQVKMSKKSIYEFNVTDLQPTGKYYFQPFVQMYDLTYVYGEEKTFTTLAARNLDGHEFVDLGLKSDTKWAVFNMTLPDGTDLLPGNDLSSEVRKQWGNSWHMPSKADWEELMDNCFWSWDVQGGMQGMLVRGVNGNTLFLPASGYMAQGKIMQYNDYGTYWTSDDAESNPGCLWCLFFGMDFVYWNPFYQVCQAGVRPVTKATIYDYD